MNIANATVKKIGKKTTNNNIATILLIDLKFF
jgi:hypothetical protein